MTQSRIMYVENKSAGLNGVGRIGRVKFSKTGRTLYYLGHELTRTTGYKYNHVDSATGQRYWVSGPRKDGNDRLYGGQQGVVVDPDVWEEYWREIRGLTDQEVPRYTDGKLK